jgi:hypothetical protein
MQSELTTVHKGNETTTVLIVQPSQIVTGSGFKVCLSGSQNCQNRINGPELMPEVVNITLSKDTTDSIAKYKGNLANHSISKNKRQGI